MKRQFALLDDPKAETENGDNGVQIILLVRWLACMLEARGRGQRRIVRWIASTGTIQIQALLPNPERGAAAGRSTDGCGLRRFEGEGKNALVVCRKKR